MKKKILNSILYLFAFIGFCLVSMYFAVKFGLTNEKGVIDSQRNTFIGTTTVQKNKAPTAISSKTTATTVKAAPKATPYFTTTDEWRVLREAIIRDREPIYKASALLGVKPRTLVSILIVEQLRLFNDNREVFKTVFAPLKILGTQSQFSWGVVGIKQETAIQTEEHLKSTSSPFYLGKTYENVLDFTTENHNKERFERIVDEHNRYYSYLYTAVIIKQLETQWKNAGYDISKKPEIISTLFNIGFIHSKPNTTPQSGGASISLTEKDYSFGSLAQEFYYSDELLDLFPQ